MGKIRADFDLAYSRLADCFETSYGTAGNRSIPSPVLLRTHFTRLVPAAGVAENGDNVSVSSYVEKEDTSDAIDFTTFNATIAQIVARQSEPGTQVDAILADLGERPA